MLYRTVNGESPLQTREETFVVDFRDDRGVDEVARFFLLELGMNRAHFIERGECSKLLSNILCGNHIHGANIESMANIRMERK